MKKLTIIAVILMMLSFMTSAQVAINTDGTAPDPSAMMDVKSTTKGLLIPRMTTSQRLSISSPAEGLMTYDTDLGIVCYYHSGSWTMVFTPSQGWGIQGNTGTNPTGNFIGTTDTARLMFRVNNQKAGTINTDGLTFFGYQAGNLTSGIRNTFVGHQSGSANTIGQFNTALGFQSMLSNQNGSANTGLGFYALQLNTTGGNNTAVGNSALWKNTAGSDNCAGGYGAMLNNTSGAFNTAFGESALDNNVTGFSNTAVGALSDVSGTSFSNSTVIGYNAVANASNQVRLGDANVTSLYCQGAYAATAGSAPNLVIDATGMFRRSTLSVPTGTASGGDVTYWGAAGTITGSSNLFWDATNNRLGIGTAIPVQQLSITGSMKLPMTTSTSGVIYLGDARFIHNYGLYNSFYGNLSGNFTVTGISNTGLGYSALYSISSGQDNTAVGANALYSEEFAAGNTAVGSNAGYSNVLNSFNTYIGDHSGFSHTSNYCTFIGYRSGYNTSTGNSNVFIGTNSGYLNQTGSGNIFLGTQSGYNETGSNKLYIDNSTTTAPLIYGDFTSNVVKINGDIGILEGGTTAMYYSMFQGADQASDITYTLPADAGTSGEVLTTNGTGTLSWASPGSVTGTGAATRLAFWNNATVLGSSANLFWDNVNSRLGIGTITPDQQLELTGNLQLPVTTATTGIIYAGANPFIHNYGTANNFMGQYCGNLTLSGALYNSAVGDSALNSLTTGDGNVAIGQGALKSVTLSGGNIAIGFRAGGNLVDPAGYNTIIGYQAGMHSNIDRNTFLGCETGFYTTTGHYNLFAGHQAGYKNTTGNNSVALGYRALYNQTGDGLTEALYNTAVGTEALYSTNPSSTSNGRYNTGVGALAMHANTTGTQNTAVGMEASYSNTSGSNNTACGYSALFANTNGVDNTAFGTNSLNGTTTGDYNTSVGASALGTNTTGSQNTAFGWSAGVVSGSLSNTIAIGYNAVVNASNKAVIGNSSVITVGGYGAWSNYSDRRLKENIRYTDALGLDFILGLKTVSYNYIDDMNKRRRDGLIAQDVRQTMTNLGIEFSGLIVDDDPRETLNLSYGDFVIPLINAVKEQQATISTLQSQVEELIKDRESLVSRLEALEKRENLVSKK
jgi:trimeric autotransporter adhesin